MNKLNIEVKTNSNAKNLKHKNDHVQTKIIVKKSLTISSRLVSTPSTSHAPPISRLVTLGFPGLSPGFSPAFPISPILSLAVTGCAIPQPQLETIGPLAEFVSRVLHKAVGFKELLETVLRSHRSPSNADPCDFSGDSKQEAEWLRFRHGVRWSGTRSHERGKELNSSNCFRLKKGDVFGIFPRFQTVGLRLWAESVWTELASLCCAILFSNTWRRFCSLALLHELSTLDRECKLVRLPFSPQ